MRGDGPDLGHARQFPVLWVDVVGEHRAPAEQTRPVIGVEVVEGLGVDLRDPGDLVAVLVDVRGHPDVGIVGDQRPTGGEQLGPGGEGEARCHRIPQSAGPVPGVDEPLPFGHRGLDVGQQRLGQVPVAGDQPRGDPQAGLRGRGEEDVHRRAEVGPEDHRRGGPGRAQPREELLGHGRGVGVVGQLRLLGQGAVVEPVEQGSAQVADGPHLREVDMGVDEAGDEHTGSQVDDLGVGMGGPGGGQIGAGGDEPVVDDEGDVGFAAQSSPGEGTVRGVEDTRTIDDHRGSP